jgi:hypothetical protein
MGRRTYFPYEAKHLDWYLEAGKFFATKYLSSSSAKVAHWNNFKFYEENGASTFTALEYITVNRSDEGKLVERLIRIVL